MLLQIIQRDYIHAFENWYVKNICVETKVEVTSSTEKVIEIQVVSRKVQQMAQPTDKEISSQSDKKLFKLPRQAPFIL